MSLLHQRIQAQDFYSPVSHDLSGNRGKHKREAAVCNMESTKDDSPMKTRFFEV